jgi:hypothetical protein
VRRFFALVNAFLSVAPAYVAAAPATPSPTPQYGYCYARTADEKKVYVSAVFEMPLEDIRAGSRVINAEFNRALVEKYGSPASPNEARSGGCPTVWNVSAAAAEEKRQIIFTHAREHKTQLVDTGWTFVRTAQTPPPGPPAGGHG